LVDRQAAQAGVAQDFERNQNMIHFHRRLSFTGIVFTIGAALFFVVAVGGKSASVSAQALSPLPLPAGTPVASIKSIVVQNREVSETDRTRATVTRGTETVAITLPFFLFKGDVIETFDETNVTVLFLDDPVPGRDNEVMLYANAKVSIGSSDSWWGRAWTKVKGAFSSRTRYSRLSAEGTEYEINVSKNEDRAILTVIEGTVEVVEGPVDIGAARPSPRFDWEDLTSAPVKFVLAYFITPSPQTQFGRVVNVKTGQTTTLTITYNVQTDCLQAHRFEFRTSEGTEWFSLVGDKNFQIQGPRGTVSETRQIQIDARRLRPSTYDARVYVICLDCQQEAGCARNILEWVYRINVEPSGPTPTPTTDVTPTPTPTVTPTPNGTTAPRAQTLRVGERQQSTISQNIDQIIPAPEPDVRFVLNWTGAVLMTTQPTYSARNLIPHFANVSERNAKFVSAREGAVFSKDARASAELANVYSDWGQPAWASFAYDIALDRSTARQAGAITIDLAEAYRLSGRLSDADQKAASFANDTSTRARNFFGNIALDRARIALDAGNAQQVEARITDAKREYAAALAYAGAQTLPAAGQINHTLLANTAEANIVGGEAALQRNAPQDAKAMFDDAVRPLQSIQQASSIYPFPVTDLGVANRGQGDAAVLSGDRKAATDAYANAKRQHEQAIAAHPDFAEAYFNLGDLYDNLGDREQAKTNYRLAIQFRPEQPAAYYPLAMLVKDDDPALAAALAAIFLKLERDAFLHGRKGDNARKLANRNPVARPPRIGEKLKELTPVIDTGRADYIVPNVVGRTEADARAAIESAGLRVGTSQSRSEDQPKGTVVRQDPRAGKQGKAHDPVNLVISAGKLVDVPDIIDDKEPTARKKIADKKLVVGNVTYRTTCESVGKVLEQSDRKTRVEVGSAINFVVGSVGDNPLTVPRYIGGSLNDAVSAIREQRFTLSRERSEETDDVSPGIVTKQEPDEGTQFAQGCPVRIEITVAEPLTTVGNYVGLPEAQARRDVSNTRLLAIVRTRESQERPGVVIDQSPPAGSRVKRSNPVTLIVSTPVVQLIPVPNVVTKSLPEATEILERAGLRLDRITYVPFVPTGEDFRVECEVTRQDPVKDRPVRPGTPVNVWVLRATVLGRPPIDCRIPR
jgi:beta-lactam-binding protein with PASTA domain/tetratricopeptide (TPR) repeat protein